MRSEWPSFFGWYAVVVWTFASTIHRTVCPGSTQTPTGSRVARSRARLAGRPRDRSDGTADHDPPVSVPGRGARTPERLRRVLHDAPARARRGRRRRAGADAARARLLRLRPRPVAAGPAHLESETGVVGRPAAAPLHAVEHTGQDQGQVQLVPELLVAAHHVRQDTLGVAPRGVDAELDVARGLLGGHRSEERRVGKQWGSLCR